MDESIGVRAFLARGQPAFITENMLQLALVLLACILAVFFVDFVNFTSVSRAQHAKV